MGGTRDRRSQPPSLEVHPSLVEMLPPRPLLAWSPPLPLSDTAWPVGFASGPLMGLEAPLTLGAPGFSSSGKGTTLFMIGKFLSQLTLPVTLEACVCVHGGVHPCLPERLLARFCVCGFSGLRRRRHGLPGPCSCCCQGDSTSSNSSWQGASCQPPSKRAVVLQGPQRQL